MVYCNFFSTFYFNFCQAIYYLKAHPNGSVKVWRTQEDQEATKNKSQKRNGYKRELRNGLWSIQGRLIQGRLLHPRPAVPTIPNNESKNSSLKMNHRGKLCINNKENNTLIDKGTVVQAIQFKVQIISLNKLNISNGVSNIFHLTISQHNYQF